MRGRSAIGRAGDAATPIAIVTLLTIAMWWPAIAGGRTILQGDAIAHGLPLVIAHAAWLAGHGAITWAPWIYGGHPLFAEGQGAFAEPLNLLFAAFVTPTLGPVASMNLFHAACMILMGVGMTGACRALGLTTASTVVAAVATAFAPLWINHQQNMTIGGALTWVPFTLWAAERWLQSPSTRASCLLGAAFALQVLAGYPQIAHGTMLYVAVSFLFGAPAGIRFRMGAYLRGVLVTGVVAVGLGAVQLLPLIELVGQSMREAGIGLVFGTPLFDYVRSALFTDVRGEVGTLGIGSMMVMVLVPFGAVLGRDARARGHLFATAFAVILSIGTVTPETAWIYDLHLIPGEHFFRVTALYMVLAIPGLAILAAFAVDRAFLPRLRGGRGAPLRIASCVAIASLCLIAVRAVGPVHPPVFQVCLAFVTLALIAFRPAPPAILRVAVAAMLVVECTTMRLHQLVFFDRHLLAMPATVRMVKADPANVAYRTFDSTFLGAIVLVSPHAPDYRRLFATSLASWANMTDRLWDLRSMNGALALELTRRTMLEPVFAAEVTGDTSTPPGLRMIDLLALRDISAFAPSARTGFVSFGLPGAENSLAFVNPAARPLFQLYTRHVTVADPAAALAVLQRARAPVLVIENPHHLPEPTDDPERAGAGASGGAATGTITIRSATATSYRVEVNAQRKLWLFLADADYPGWTASIDGKDVSLFASQVLGKAVAVPQGDHEVTLRFQSRTIALGLAVTLLTCLILCVGAFAGTAAAMRRASGGRGQR